MPDIFINTSGVLGNITGEVTQNLTGNLYLTLVLIFIFLVIVALIFRLPFDLISIFLIPFVLVLWAYQGGSFLIIGSLFFVYLAFLVAKNWFIK